VFKIICRIFVAESLYFCYQFCGTFAVALMLCAAGSLLDFFGPEVAAQGVTRHYGAMVKYVQYLLSKRDAHGLLAYGLGDWCDANSKHGCDPPGQLTPLGVTGTSILFSNCVLLSRFASDILHNSSEALYWSSVAESVRADYLASHLWPPSNGSQTSPAMPLATGLLNSSALQLTALHALIADIESRDYHQTGGDIGHRFILNALGQSPGGSNIVARITNSTSFPSYGAMLAAGATSLPEQWDGSGSQLHSMLGHVDEWFYRYVLGFAPPYASSLVPFPALVIAPQPVEGIDWARGHWRDVSVHWQWLENASRSSTRVLRIDVVVPAAAMPLPVMLRAPLVGAAAAQALYEGVCDAVAFSDSGGVVPCAGGCNLMAANCRGLRLQANGDILLSSGAWTVSAVYATNGDL
jgi:hypothetical protein